MKLLAMFIRFLAYYLFRGTAKLVELIGRYLVFNTSSPQAGRVHRNLKYGRSRKQAVDVFVPSGKGPFPVLVYIHGGGFMCMDKSSYDRICRCFASEGVLVFNVNYRLAPRARFHKQIHDVTRAIRFAYDRARDFGGDSSMIFLAGDSAGAFFCSWYAAALGDPGMLEGFKTADLVPPQCIRGLLLYYGVYNWKSAFRLKPRAAMRFIAESTFGEDRSSHGNTFLAVSPQLHAGTDYPPCLVVTGGTDPIRTQSYDFALLLDRKGIDCRRLFLPGWRHPASTHGFLAVWFLPCASKALRESQDFLKEKCKA